MEQRHSSPSSRSRSPRPGTYRKRSNSLPFMEALGCSTPEARMMLAEGRAAVRNRRRGRQNRHANEEENATTFDPRNHLKYLDSSYQENYLPMPQVTKVAHSRHPSDATDKSTSTIVAPTRSTESSGNGAPSPLGNYSANLALFIKAQLRSLPTYTSPDQISPRSCPDFSFQLRTPPQSPNKTLRRPSNAPKVIDIPPIRPPMQSAFSAWSSTDDSEDDDVPALPDVEQPSLATVSKASNRSTPSVLGYYAESDESLLFSSTSMEDEPHTARGFQFPQSPEPLYSSNEAHPSPDSDDDGYYSASHSSRLQFTSSSAPSISSSSASASSYFEYKRPVSNIFPPHMKDRVVAAVMPPKGKMLTAISPFEGAALSDVHDVFIESQHRVHVDGLSFDMLRDFTVPTSRVSTPV